MTDTVQVDVNTDDLESFEALLHGKAEAAPAADEPEDEPDDDSDSTDDDTVETPEDLEDIPDEEDAEDGEEPEPQPKKRVSAKERITELTAARYAAEREVTRLRQELEARSKDTPKPEPEAPQETQSSRPDPDAKDGNGELLYPLGEFDPKWIADFNEYLFENKFKAVEAQREQREAEAKKATADAELFNDWNQKLAKSAEGIEDLHESIATLDTEFGALEGEQAEYLAKTIMTMEYGPEVLYYLANNVDEARKIVASGTVAATLALGGIERDIRAAVTKAAPTVRKTKAPEPPMTTRGNIGKTGVAPDTDDLDAFETLLYPKRK